MKTALEIYELMDGECPFIIHPSVKPYIIEAMKLYATEKVKKALRLAVSTAQGYVSQADGDLLAHFIGELESELVNNIINEI